MTRGKVPTRLVLVVVACVVVGVIGFQAVAERTRVNRRLQKEDELQNSLRVRLSSSVEKHARLQFENSKLGLEKDELQKQLIELSNSRQDEKGKFEKDIKDLNRQFHDKELEVQKLEDEVLDLKQSKSRGARKREQKEKAFASLQDKNSALSKEIEDLSAEIKMLKEGGGKKLSETNIKSVVESTDQLATRLPVDGAKVDEETAERARMLVTDKHKGPQGDEHLSQSADDPNGTDKEDDEESEDKTDVIDTDEETDKEELQIETTNDEDPENNDFKDDDEGKTVDDKEEAQDDADDKDGDVKSVEGRIFPEGDDEADPIEDQEETLDNTE